MPVVPKCISGHIKAYESDPHRTHPQVALPILQQTPYDIVPCSLSRIISGAEIIPPVDSSTVAVKAHMKQSSFSRGNPQCAVIVDDNVSNILAPD
jgi:hypothetical protein